MRVFAFSVWQTERNVASHNVFYFELHVALIASCKFTWPQSRKDLHEPRLCTENLFRRQSHNGESGDTDKAQKNGLFSYKIV